jgi:hypothetical protein
VQAPNLPRPVVPSRLATAPASSIYIAHVAYDPYPAAPSAARLLTSATYPRHISRVLTHAPKSHNRRVCPLEQKLVIAQTYVVPDGDAALPHRPRSRPPPPPSAYPVRLHTRGSRSYLTKATLPAPGDPTTTTDPSRLLSPKLILPKNKTTKPRGDAVRQRPAPHPRRRGAFNQIKHTPSHQRRQAD